MSWRVWDLALLFITSGITTPLLAQDGSGGAQRTPESAHAFLAQSLADATFAPQFKLTAGKACTKSGYCEYNYQIGSNWPVYLKGTYANTSPCLSIIKPTGVDNDLLFQSDTDDDKRSVTSVARVLADGSISVDVNGDYGPYALTSYTAVSRPNDLQIDWTKVADAGSAESLFGGTYTRVLIIRSDAPDLNIYIRSSDLARRVAIAAVFLKNHCDKAAETGF